jgi:hypothetical protein
MFLQKKLGEPLLFTLCIYMIACHVNLAIYIDLKHDIFFFVLHHSQLFDEILQTQSLICLYKL